MALPSDWVSPGGKAVLWVVLFGLAKTFQYVGLAILGAEGVRRLKRHWRKLRK